MDFPEYLGSFVTLHPHPTPLASEHSSRMVPPFALFSSDRVHGWGFSGSLGNLAHLWLLLPSFHTCLLGFQRSDLNLYPLISFSGAHSLVGISPCVHPCHPSLTTSKAEIITASQSWPSVVVHPGGKLCLFPASRTTRLLALPTAALPPSPVHSTSSLWHIFSSLRLPLLGPVSCPLAPLDLTPDFSLVPACSLNSPLCSHRHRGLPRRPNQTSSPGSGQSPAFPPGPSKCSSLTSLP